MTGKGHTANFSIKTGLSEKSHPAGKGCNDVESPDGVSEDEVVAWLQYPLEDSFDKSCYSELFGQWPSSLGKASSGAGEVGASRLSGGVGNAMGNGSVGFDDRTGAGISARVNNAEAALALGAGRAAGLIPHSGLEVFSKVRTAMQPPVSSQVSSLPRSNHSFPAPSSFPKHPFGKSELATVSSSKLPPRLRNAGSPSNKLPPQTTEEGLHIVSNGSAANATLKPDSSYAGPISNGLSSKYDQGKLHLRDRSALSGSTCGSTVSEQSFLPGYNGSRKPSSSQIQVSSSQPSAGSYITEEATLRVVNTSPNSSSRGLMFTVPANVVTTGRLASNSLEPRPLEKKSDVSCAGGSSPAANTGFKEASCIGKQKLDLSECQSEEVEGESAEMKEPPKRSTKRHRAAEVHNLSERRRRNRINEKMKALQELIPNSNKTDKASVLDEAIEYLKMLQLQIQMVSMRSGLSLSPMMIPLGMPHLQMAQLAPVGLGVPVGHPGMGMGMGMDMSHAVAGRPFQSLPPTYSHFGIPCQTATAIDSQNINHPSHNPEISLSDISTSEQVPHQAEQQNLLFFRLNQQQNQPQQDCFPGESPSNAMSDSSDEQADS